MELNNNVPRDWIGGLKDHWKDDILSGFVVFLIALPLCIGISLASGVPPLSGILAAVVGGIVVGFFSGSHVTINGPAAGLIVVILHAIESLGEGDQTLGFEKMLACLVVAGILQVILGLLKTGKFMSVHPPSVLHGMLAAIGIIIMSKQIYVLLGIKPAAKSIVGLIAGVPSAIFQSNPEIASIGIASLLICILLPMIPNQYVKKLPAPLIAVIVGIIMGEMFDLEHEHHFVILEYDYAIGPDSLVNLPQQVVNMVGSPNFSSIFSVKSFIAIFTIFFVANLESLLSAKAVEQLDPYHRKTDFNKEMIGKGIGNAILGFIGGLPIIAEIVRSSANVQNGAKTRWSNFFHGLFLFVFVIAFPTIIHKIPLASLAGILIFVGFRLAHPKQLKETLSIGKEQLIYFSITVTVTVVEDLLVGIFCGLMAKFINDAFYGARPTNMFFAKAEIIQTGDIYKIIIHNNVLVFTNHLNLQDKINSIPERKEIIIDVSNVKYIDHTSLDNLEIIKKKYILKDGKFSIIGMEGFKKFSNHPLAAMKR